MQGFTLISIDTVEIDENIPATQIGRKFDTVLRLGNSLGEHTLRSSAAEYPTGIDLETCAAI
jgi:hypothetical protein